MTRKFNIEIRDYESGNVEDALTVDRIESSVVSLLDSIDSEGVVVVTEATE